MNEYNERVYAHTLIKFEGYKNLANLGTGNYRPESIKVFSLNEDPIRITTVGEEIPFEVKDDILIVRERGCCLLDVEVEYYARIQEFKAKDYPKGKANNFMVEVHIGEDND